MLRERYQKESNGKTYLLLNKSKESYEERMIREGVPAGILPLVKSEQEGNYKYDITGRRTLAMTFERVPMNAEQVRKVLQEILDILERGREYLLLEENFILQPEYIYLRIPEYEVTLCYYPEYGISFREQMGKLFEMLLNRVDYREEKAISLVYALYMQLQEPDVTLERIREKLWQQMRGQAETAEEKSDLSDVLETSDRIAYRKTELSGKRMTENKKKQLSGIIKKKINLWERLKKETGFREKLPEKVISTVSASCVAEAAPEWDAQYTRVLSVKGAKSCPQLISKENGEPVLLEKFPFYVGSLAGYMDYLIEKDTVSRFHAKFIKRENAFFLEDLNSTNGTRVNGELLNVQEQRRLSEGDCIAFADAEYSFYSDFNNRLE